MDAEDRDLLTATFAQALESRRGRNGDHVLTELGWADLVASAPRDAIEIVFGLLGRANVTSSCLSDVVAVMAGLPPGTAVVLTVLMYGTFGIFAVVGLVLNGISVLEDDPDLNRQLVTALGEAGYVVDKAMDGEEGHYLGETEPYDAVVLDLGLPVLDGVSVLEKWRRAGKKMPVLILTARDRWSDKVAGFDAGADDYVPKPFHMEEVLARVRALLRRTAGHATSELTCGPMILDTKSARVTVNGTAIKLTSLEFRLLAYLMHHVGKVVSRTELVEHLYDQDFDRDSNTIEVFIGRLRKKLGVDVLHTIRGMGYCVSEPDNAN